MSNHNVSPNHVAILVPSVHKASECLRPLGFHIGDAEDWDGEGTREIYVEREKSNSLLLMEPIRPGAYQRAMNKRGPGLHHLAIDVVGLDGFLESLSGSGWLLHPISIRTMKKTRTAYLAKPGFPALIEVQERDALSQHAPFVEKVFLPTELSSSKLIEHVGLGGMVEATGKAASLVLGGKTILISDLF